MKNMSSWIQSVNLNLTIIAPHALEKIIQKFMYEENTVEPTQVAPGQGKIPKSILHEKDFDVKSFPCLFPDGKCRRKTTLGHQMSNCIAIKRDSIS